MKLHSNTHKVYIDHDNISLNDSSLNHKEENPHQWIDRLLFPLFLIGSICLFIYFIPETIYHTLHTSYMLVTGKFFT